MTKTYSEETYSVLRNCLLSRKGTCEGKTFVRCVPKPRGYGKDGADGWKLPEKGAREMAQRVVAEVNDPGVIVSHNPDVGGYYVRVETTTAVFALICHMKS